MTHCSYYCFYVHFYNTHVLTVLPTLLHFMQTIGTSYQAEILHYLIFHPMNQQKDLPQRLDKFWLGGRKPQIAK
jgi:hypothetical protein